MSLRRISVINSSALFGVGVIENSSLFSEANLGPSWELDSRVGTAEKGVKTLRFWRVKTGGFLRVFVGVTGENFQFFRFRTDGKCEETGIWSRVLVDSFRMLVFPGSFFCFCLNHVVNTHRIFLYPNQKPQSHRRFCLEFFEVWKILSDGWKLINCYNMKVFQKPKLWGPYQWPYKWI